MSLADGDFAHLILALALLLAAAHSLGWVAVRLRQPRVAGEIVGGLLLGPSLFGHLLPDWYETTFANSDITDTGLRMTYQLGLILLMYCSGAQLRSILSKSEGRPVAAISIIGSVLPFVGGLVLVLNWDGANRSSAAPTTGSPSRWSSRWRWPSRASP